MKRLRFWGLVPVFCLLALPVWADNELKLGVGVDTKFNQIVEVPLTLSTTDQVQGLVAAFDWDGAAGEGVALVDGPAIAGADTVVRRPEDSYMVLGVVMDTDGSGTVAINPGDDLLVATAEIRCKSLEQVTPIVFRDATYASVEGGPVLDNIVVVGGLSIGQGDGLDLTNGSFSCVASMDRFYIDDATANSNTGYAKVIMESRNDVEGYVVALCHNPAELSLDGDPEVGVAATSNGADFSAAESFSDGGTLGVVMDLLSPYDGNVIPAGDLKHIATFRYTCEAGEGDYPLTFCNLELGDPLKENVMVVGGLSVNPVLQDGEFHCVPGCSPVPENLAAGNCNDGVDNDCDGLVDGLDPGCQAPAVQSFVCGSDTVDPLTGLPGQAEVSIGPEADPPVPPPFPPPYPASIPPSPTPPNPPNNFPRVGPSTDICFYILNPIPDDEPLPPEGPEDPPAPPPQAYQHIQGFSMALTYCCSIIPVGPFDITGTILDEIGAEYVKADADMVVDELDPTDACELIIGVLVDALPPFEGTTIPPTDRVQKMGCIKFAPIIGVAECGDCCPIDFTDGVDGTGKVPINNLISVDNYSRVPAQLISCSLCIVNKECFFRGDCNFSGDSGTDGSLAVDIADAAAVVSYLFLKGTYYEFEPPCLDACDCNDDSRIDLADAVCILRYLFQHGRFPPAPGPGWRETSLPKPQVEPTGCGVDPTQDYLDCAAGNRC